MVHLRLLRAAASFLALASLHANAYWIISHSILTHDRLDPIVSPGKVASHVHTVVGASNFGPTVSVESLQASNCTTAPVQKDKSSYWAPQLYSVNSNGTYTLIPNIFVNTYYLNRDGPTQKNISAFPVGLRMIAGNMYRNTFNDSNTADKAVSFVCLDGKTNPQTNAFPTNETCPNGLRAQIVFPSCWNGKDLDSSDHQSHMSYPVGGFPDTGDCPIDYPIKVMTLFHEWIFDVGKFPFTPGGKNWVFSFGDETGYGMHADFVNGWDQQVLEDAVNQCTGQIGGVLTNCPPFVPYLDNNLAGSCTTPSVVVEEIYGPLSALPGCNPIPAQQGAQCPNTTTPAIKGLSGNGTNGVSETTGAGSGGTNGTVPLSIVQGSETTGDGETSGTGNGTTGASSNTISSLASSSPLSSSLSESSSSESVPASSAMGE